MRHESSDSEEERSDSEEQHERGWWYVPLIILITFEVYKKAPFLRFLILMSALCSDVSSVRYYDFDEFAGPVHAPIASEPGISSTWKLLHLLGT